MSAGNNLQHLPCVGEQMRDLSSIGDTLFILTYFGAIRWRMSDCGDFDHPRKDTGFG